MKDDRAQETEVEQAKAALLAVAEQASPLHWVREHPLLALTLALGAGLAAGAGDRKGVAARIATALAMKHL